MTEQLRETQREKAPDQRTRQDPLTVPPVGSRLGDTAAVRHIRCDAIMSRAIPLCCMRERGHEGSHSHAMLDTDRVYVWPAERAFVKVDARDQAKGIVRSDPIIVSDPSQR